MSAIHEIDSEDLWKRIGLDELRQALAEIERLSRQFVQSLRVLPPCTTRVRVTLISQIGDTGTRRDRERERQGGADVRRCGWSTGSMTG